MRNLSKSKLLSFRQCAKRLWLEIHHPELCEDSAGTEASFAVGNQVGDIARQLYDPEGKGSFLDLDNISFAELLEQSETLCKTSKQPIFEAGFVAGGALALADVMLPTRQGRKRAWRMVEVKSSTSIKDYHRDDAAIQAFVARKAGVPLAGIALAHIDKNWVYPGKNDYQGLLVENDLTEEAFARGPEVEIWIAEAQTIARKRKEPAITTGSQCCYALRLRLSAVLRWSGAASGIPDQLATPHSDQKDLKALIDEGVSDLRDVPDELLNERQLRVKHCTLTGETYFDAAGAAADLAAHKLPGYFLDFETIQFAIPIWKGTRPYQQIPFQFSLHRLSRTGKLEHKAFLDLSGKDPSKAFAEALIAACGERGPVFVYNAAFEMTRIKELANCFKRLKKPLLAINERIVDLLRVAEARYYHPSQQGSWSIKKLLPAVAPDLRYDALEGVQDGGMAMEAYKEAIYPKTSVDRKDEIEKQLLKYCGLDTLAMVQIWELFSKK